MAPTKNKYRFCYLQFDNANNLACIKHGYNCPPVKCRRCGCWGHTDEEHLRADLDDMMEETLIRHYRPLVPKIIVDYGSKESTVEEVD